MRVLVTPSDTGACGNYRLIFPSEVLMSWGMDITIDTGNDGLLVEWSRPWGNDPTGVEVRGVKPIDYDVWVIQRPLDKHWVDCIPFVQANGTAVVVELDDDFWTIHHENAAYQSSDPKLSPQRNRDHLARACRLADLVTVSTPSLVDVVPTGRVAQLPNFVPAAYLSMERHTEANWSLFGKRTVVGWSGSPLTHPDDLQVMGDACVRACRNTNSIFFSIGSKLTPSILGFDAREAAFTEWVQMDKYPSVVTGLDVGVVPLKDTRFNECKSWLKGLEYAALGVAFVATPTLEYQALAALGAGELARTPQKWYGRLRRLLVNGEYREDRTGAGRAAASLLTYEGNAHIWAEAWNDALDLYKKRPLRGVPA